MRCEMRPSSSWESNDEHQDKVRYRNRKREKGRGAAQTPTRSTHERTSAGWLEEAPTGDSCSAVTGDLGLWIESLLSRSA